MCVSLSERTQVLLTVDQRRRLELIAVREGTSVGAVIRKAIERYDPDSADVHDDLDAVFALGLPVDDWPDMKAEIISAAAR